MDSDRDRGRPRRGSSPTARVLLRGCKLTVVKGPRAGQEFVTAADVIRVGKADDNDVVLDEGTVSRVHFEIVRRPKGYLLRDLRSTNGTFLDGAEIKEAYLRAGAVVGAGAAQLRFQPVEESIEIRPSDRTSLGELVGASPVMRLVFGLVEQLAPTDATVLVEGEEGTGKTLIARAVHELSRRRAGPFVVVPCRALDPASLERELIGHETGAGQGGEAGREGAFERAAGGTLVLDDVDELSHDLQTKVLRVLEQRELRRLGGTKTIQIDVRVVATARGSLPHQVERGRFREDLLGRLRVASIHAPPLRERLEDVPLLLDRWLGADGAPLEGETIAALQRHDWPGNVAELARFVERALSRAVVGATGPLGGAGGSATSAAGADPGDAFAFDPALPFRDHKERWSDEFERRYLVWLLARAAGNISKAARDADMDRKYLHKLLKKHGISVPGAD